MKSFPFHVSQNRLKLPCFLALKAWPVLQNSKLRYPQPPWNHPLQSEDSIVQAIDMADCGTSCDIQKHEETICSELDPSNVFCYGFNLMLFFFPVEKAVKAGELAQWLILLPQKHKDQDSHPQSPCQSWRRGSLPVIPALCEQRDRHRAPGARWRRH